MIRQSAVPTDASSGYAKGCLCIQTDGAAGSTMYINEGSATSCDFNLIGAFLVDVDAGASGTAGTVDVFPSTAAKGKLQIAAADSDGDTTTVLVNASQAAARTFSIPDPGASAKFQMNAVEAGLVNGAIGIKDGLVALTKAGVAAMTLAAPTATTDDGKRLRIVATTANAHTVTQASPGLNNLGASGDVATFGGAVGDMIELIAYQGVWYITNVINVTVA